MKRSIALIAAAVFLAASGWGTARAATSRGNAATVQVMLMEFKLVPSTKAVKAGLVTFVVTNMGELRHEFVVLKTPIPAAKLRMNGMAAVEQGRVGEIGALTPGQTRKLTLNLKPGHYALICNLPGHYKAGQHADLNVR